MQQRKLTFFLFIVIVGFFANGRVVFAADPKPTIRDDSYAAKYISQSEADPITMEAGSYKLITIKFKNVGTATWQNETSPPAGEAGRYISAYTMEPRDRNSVFFGKGGWNSPKQIGRMVWTIQPGEIGEYGVPLYAPATPGEYTEQFYLAAENWTWIKNGYFYLKINVVAPPKNVAAESETGNSKLETGNTETGNSEIDADGAYAANRFILSPKAVTAAGGERVKVIVGFQNTGTATWKQYSLKANEPTALASVEQLTFADESWRDSALVLEKGVVVAPQSIVREDLYFRAPTKQGTYTADFAFVADDKTVAIASVPVTVTSDAPTHVEESSGATQPTPRLAEEPRIRVGLWQPTENTVQFVSYEDEYDVYAGKVKQGTLSRTKIGILRYTDPPAGETGGIYSYKGDGLDFTSAEYIRLAPATNPRAVFTMHNWERLVSWKGPLNFNAYRGALELRIGQINPTLWAVNDLLLEDYMKGVAENSNGSPTEYLKAQAVAQRSYAYYTIQSDKYGIFDVVATTGDQLYLGYNSETLMPNFVAATEATRGYMATYDVDANPATPNDVVITPYFANTDGRTRSWTEVWGGSHKPWLISVKAEYDNGRRLYGHGVGMSQLDASARAKAEGLTWDALVKYYYTGVEVERMYQ